METLNLFLSLPSSVKNHPVLTASLLWVQHHIWTYILVVSRLKVFQELEVTSVSGEVDWIWKMYISGSGGRRGRTVCMTLVKSAGKPGTPNQLVQSCPQSWLHCFLPCLLTALFISPVLLRVSGWCESSYQRKRWTQGPRAYAIWRLGKERTLYRLLRDTFFNCRTFFWATDFTLFSYELSLKSCHFCPVL